MERNYQCCLCGYYFENPHTPPTQCPDCNCTMIREVLKGTMDSVAPESVAHIKKKLENCPNYDSVSNTGAQSYHKLDLIREVDVSRANVKLEPEISTVMVRQRCRHCGLVYGQAAIPLSRRDVMERMGILGEVESKIPGWRPA